MDPLERKIMKNIEELLRRITREEERDSASEQLESITYHDQPIIRRASRLSPQSSVQEAPEVQTVLTHSRTDRYGDDDPEHPPYPLDTPGIYRNLYRMHEGTYGQSGRSERFYHEALLAKDYIDDQPYFRSYPRRYVREYETLNLKELRGYFTWRARFRMQLADRYPADYLTLHIYELLHNIGAEDAPDAHEQLKNALHLLSGDSPISDAQKNIWLRDHAIYHRLEDSPDLISPEQRSYDEAIGGIIERDENDKKRFLESLSMLSSYRLLKSPFYKREPVLYAELLWRFYHELEAYYAKRRKYSLQESLFGFPDRSMETMFYDATFYDYLGGRKYTIRPTPYTTYTIDGTSLIVTRYHGRPGKNAQLGILLKTFDRLMREAYQFQSRLSPDSRCPKYVQDMIRKIILAYQKEQAEKEAMERMRVLKEEEERKEKERRTIHFDLNALEGIRAAADRTQASLLIDTDEETNPLSEKPAPEPSASQSTAAVPDAMQVSEKEDDQMEETLLSGQERTYLCLLLEGKDPSVYLKEQHLMESLLVDRINDRLMDLIGDTVLEMPDGYGVLIDDYLETVKGIL